MKYDAAFPEAVHEDACSHLLAHVREHQIQEELCFALWRPSTGAARRTALIFQIVRPLDGERDLHGNVSFEAGYLTRATKLACLEQAGLAFMHNHLTAGWQDMSGPDVIAERDRIAPVSRATGLPLVGLTLGTDGSWSARFWMWNGRKFECSWCDKVRVLGRRLQVTYNERSMPLPKRQVALQRTIDTWGQTRQNEIARLRIGVIGVGSVGCVVAEILARMGIQELALIDPDKIERHNLDRLLYASSEDIGKYKVEFMARHLRRGATADKFRVYAYNEHIQDEIGYQAALDCDVLFAAVDRPLPKDLLNRIAYAHCIPVISGGVFVDNKSNGTLGQATWSVSSVGPGRRCLRCDGQYTSSDVMMERDGSLDDPQYIADLQGQGDVPRNQNVFPFSANLASFMVIEMIRLIVAENWWPDSGGKLQYTLVPNQLATQQETCRPNCSVCERIAYGDQEIYPFIMPQEGKDVSKLTSENLARLVSNRVRVWLASFTGGRDGPD